jgi:uncharacterized protein (TIGR02001 family)
VNAGKPVTRSLHRLDAVRRSAVGLSFALFAASVPAQISGNASLLSDYRYRGVSLSDNKPAAQLGLVYDHASGWYAGLFLSTVRFRASVDRELQTIYFAGHAWRTAAGTSFDAGISHSRSSGDQSYSYSELYFGFAANNLSGRLYYSPRYFGDRGDTLYAELNGAHLLGERVRLLAHIGVLRSSGAVYNLYRRPDFVVDGRVGVAIDLDAFTVQLSGVAVSSNGAYPLADPPRRNGIVLLVSRSF